MKKIFLILLFLTISLAIKGQKKHNTYSSLWENVHAYELKLLPKSASSEVEKIYLKAKKDKNSPQLIKTLIYKSKFSFVLEEDSEIKVITQLQAEIKTSASPTKNILESILAKLYWEYYNKNRWKIYQRTKTETKSVDFRTWDLQTLFSEIAFHYKKSLENSKLTQNTALQSYKDILDLEENSQKYRPTLFDFLSHNALDFYQINEARISQPKSKFELKKDSYFTHFEEENLVHKDSSSLELAALKTYQQLLHFHKKDKNPTAYITVYIDALEFIYKNSISKNKENLLLQSYKQLQKKYRHHAISTQLDYKIAKRYKKQADQYNPKGNTENQFKNKEALAACNLAIGLFPNSEGSKNCLALKAQIQSKKLRIQSEKHIPTNSHTRLLIEYSNIDKLYFTAFKINKKESAQFRKIYSDSLKIRFLNKKPPTEKWEVPLKTENDFQKHQTEIVTPKFTHGEYILFVTTSKDTISHTKLNAISTLQATDLALIQNSENGVYSYQVVNRNNGRPIPNAKVNLKNSRTTSTYNKHLDKSFQTDKNGWFSYKPKARHQNLVATVTNGEETAYFGNYYLNDWQRYDDKEEDLEIEIKPFIFTDRSIYRPGQTVFFKAILLKKQGTKTEAFTKEYVELIVEDPNGQEVQKLDLKLNEFGAISGEFKLPNNGLTGTYSFEIDESEKQPSKFYNTADFDFDYDANFSISVEEYKRPKFKTEFKPTKETYKLNDSIIATGTATAFSGSTISEAKVSYRVVRTANFPSWYRWSQRNFQQSERLEITHGETTTDAQGNYKIYFKAIPDAKITKESQPTFNYVVYADVTDINGETHDTQTTIKVGYHALTSKISIPEKLDKTQTTHSIHLETKNLNNQFVAAKGILKIYKLTAPKKPLRSRSWPAPDYQEITKTEFETLFPNEPYDKISQEKGKLVFQQKFDTEKSKKIELKNIQQWISGKYIALLECTDKFNQTVKEEQQFSVFSDKETRVADQDLFFIKTDKQHYQPNETIQLKIGSASKDITLSLAIEKNHKIVKRHFIHLNNEIKTLTIPVTKKDIGGFAIKYEYVNYNEFHKGNLSISVPYKAHNLTIETLTFRNKLQPGAEQTWAFKIKGNQKENVAAEILASMYDASLDEFKSHQWQFSPTAKNNYRTYGNSSTAHNSFGTTYFVIRNNSYAKYHFQQQKFDQLNWFGFSFTNNNWIQTSYLKSIRKTLVLKNIYDKTIKKGTIQGTVYDEDKQPIAGVSVSIEGNSKGTSTDFDGNFTLKANKRDKLTFTYIGFEPLTIKLTKNNQYNIMLSQSSSELEEVIVVGYGSQRKASLTGAVSKTRVSDISSALQGQVSGINLGYTNGESSNILIRGTSSTPNSPPLYVVDGVPVENFDLSSIGVNDISSLDVLKDAAATAVYGARGANGVVLISTKTGLKKIEEELNQVQARSNLKETAFFFPHLRTDKNGDIRFEFTMPEALTKWKLQLLAHTKKLQTATKTLTSFTQKELMITPNAPRFLREGDQISISSKIASMSTKQLTGFAQLQLTDALTGKNINEFLLNTVKTKNFSIAAKGNTQVSWTLQIPENIQAVQYKIVAKAGDFSDGEQNVLPVLSNRMLVTETLPLWVNANETKTFSLDKLKNNTSKTLKNHKLTLEMTTNPAWYAVQALPYLMEYPYECAEQTFSRYYANVLASHLVNNNPKIKAVFKQWQSSDALLSNLEKNQELKSLIIQETPWLRDAQSETEQKKRIALLFDLEKTKNNLTKNLEQLEQMQMSNGGFPWFKGSRYANRNITQHIVAGFGHLKKLGIQGNSVTEEKIIKKALQFLDKEITDDYNKLTQKASEIRQRENNKNKGIQAEKDYLAKNHLNSSQLHYLYLRSFYNKIAIPNTSINALTFYKKQTAQFWKEAKLYNKGLSALILYREGKETLAKNIIQSLKENSITSSEMGMYWKENTSSWYWYQSPIETQSLFIEVFAEIDNDTKTIDALKKYLIKNKQTHSWKTTKATTEAIYALLLQGSDWLAIENSLDLVIGNKKIEPSKLENVKTEAGTGYFKTSWKPNEITPEMATVTISKKDKGMAWGALYWQYFEDLDKITSTNTSLTIAKKLFLKSNSKQGKVLTEITENTNLKVGSLITIRIEIATDRDLEFIHLKDLRAAGVEPINVLSSYKWQDGLGYYESTKDASSHFFFDNLPKGTYVFEYDVRANNSGNFSNGISSIESMYAPEFSSHSKGNRLHIH
ncbi:alpha-2-macroglobulin family protein [Flavicella sediminum]|uniref:alpha-2-macroglobulin family protein n=1 Tax=Flavicella sediminum TaxID=2585141 RepID=UPI001124945D|nr:MG2 domain-containing protein [Flavicella sediminum]